MWSFIKRSNLCQNYQPKPFCQHKYHHEPPPLSSSTNHELNILCQSILSAPSWNPRRTWRKPQSSRQFTGFRLRYPDKRRGRKRFHSYRTTRQSHEILNIATPLLKESTANYLETSEGFLDLGDTLTVAKVWIWRCPSIRNSWCRGYFAIGMRGVIM